MPSARTAIEPAGARAPVDTGDTLHPEASCGAGSSGTGSADAFVSGDFGSSVAGGVTGGGFVAVGAMAHWASCPFGITAHAPGPLHVATSTLSPTQRNAFFLSSEQFQRFVTSLHFAAPPKRSMNVGHSQIPGSVWCEAPP